MSRKGKKVKTTKQKKDGEQNTFCSPSFGIPNPHRLASATPVRGISRRWCGPFGTWEQPGMRQI